jgi:hypothetical protein
MYHDIDSRTSALDGPDADGQTNGLSNSATPPRFGRLAMCVAAASALVIGVMGTVAYGVWFNHDQQAYAEAMAGARRALGNGASAGAAVMAKSASVTALSAAAVLAKTPQPSPAVATSSATVAASAAVADPEAGGRFASWTGQVKAPTAHADVVADAAPRAPASASAATPAAAPRRPASATTAPTQQLAASRPGRDGRATSQERRAAPESAKHKNNLFARMGLFFRRVSYRQHGNTNRQDIYSHP